MAAADVLDWDDLRFFLRAAQAGTLAAAARAMGVDHSTVGRRLTSLERVLGAPVVIRAPDGLHLTPLGESLVPLAEQVERAVANVQGRASQQPARVRLAMPTGFTKLFSANLARLRASYPQLTLELSSGSRQVDLEKGEADLAIRSGPVLEQGLVARPIGESGWSLYASNRYLSRHPPPADVDDLRGHELIGYDLTLSAVPAAKWVEQRLRHATLALRSREMTDMLAAALSGVGLAALPCIVADGEPGLVRVTPTVLATRTLSLVYPTEARLSPPVQAVIAFVVEVMQEHAHMIAGTSPPAPDEGGTRAG
jgi:DNA-binding transcriptional LysR family regulator